MEIEKLLKLETTVEDKIEMIISNNFDIMYKGKAAVTIDKWDKLRMEILALHKSEFKKLTMYDETIETTTSNSTTPGNILSDNELYTFFGEYGVAYKKELNLIKALNDYIDWYGCRDSKMDKILPIEHQKGVVVTAMTLLKELLNQQL